MNILERLKQSLDAEECGMTNEQLGGEQGAFSFQPKDEWAIQEAVKWKEQTGGNVTVLKAGSIIWGIEKRMFVCKDHVTQGLKNISTPHVQKLTADYREQCLYCQQAASFRLFHFISFSKSE